MELPKILRKTFWLKDYQRLGQDLAKPKKSSQQQTFDALTPEDELMVFYENLKSVGLGSNFLDEEEIRLLKKNR